MVAINRLAADAADASIAIHAARPRCAVAELAVKQGIRHKAASDGNSVAPALRERAGLLAAIESGMVLFLPLRMLLLFLPGLGRTID